MIVRELLADCYGCRGDLADSIELEAAMRRGAALAGATVLGGSCTQYQPVGLTLFLPLAESHVLVSTWPEHEFVIVSVLLCNESMDPRAVADEILGVLRPRSIRWHAVRHEVAPHSEAAEAVGLSTLAGVEPEAAE